jgi:predicted component of type VI protein secretion system
MKTLLSFTIAISLVLLVCGCNSTPEAAPAGNTPTQPETTSTAAPDLTPNPDGTAAGKEDVPAPDKGPGAPGNEMPADSQ